MVLSARARLALVLIAAIAFLLRFFPAENDPSLSTPDEIYQVLEQAHRLSFGYGVVPPGFRQGLHSWALPGVLAGVMRVTALVDDGADGYLTGLALVLSYLALAPVMVAFLLAYRRHHPHGVWPAVAAAAAGAVWFELIYFSAKPLPEVVATDALLPGLYLLHTAAGDAGRRRYLAAGALLALALGLRIQLLPGVVLGLGLFEWLARRQAEPAAARWAPLALGFVPVLLAFGALDWITWGAPFQSMWKGALAGGGSYGPADPRAPWYAYVRDVGRLWGLGLLPIGALVALGARRWPLGLAVAAGVLVTQSALPMREYRLLYPALALLLVLAGLGTAEALVWLTPRLKRIHLGVVCVAAVGLWSAGSIALSARLSTRVVTVRPAPPPNERFPLLWSAHASGLAGLRSLSLDRSTCGVGLGIPWYFSGGYTYLHKDIPIFQAPTQQELTRLQQHFNALLAPAGTGFRIGPFLADECYYGVCLFRRPGGCTPPPAGYSLSGSISTEP